MTKLGREGQPLAESSLESSSKELSGATVGAMAGVVLSRFSGIIRQQILSFVFGAGLATDAFNIAARYPNSLRDLLADGALSSAFTKSLVEAKLQGRAAESKLIAVVTAFFGCVTLALAILGCTFAEPFMRATTSEAFVARGGLPLATNLFRILAFYLPIVMFSASAMAILGVYRQTFKATFASAFFNVGNIAGALILAPIFAWFGQDPIYGLATGAIAGGFFQFIYSARPLRELGLLVRPKIAWRDLTDFRPLRDVLFMMGPRALSQGAMVLALFINTLLASKGNGTITYISNAQTIILVPVGLFGVASGFSSLPVLTEAANEPGGQRFANLLGQSISGAMWLAFFSLVAFALLATPFCSVLFAHGRFTHADAIATATAVCAYGIAIVFNSASKVVHQGFFALGQTRQVVINSLIYLAVNTTCSWYFSKFDSGPVPFGLSNSLAAACDFSLNVFFLHKICGKKDINLFLHSAKAGFSIPRIAVLSALAFPLAIGGIVWASRITNYATLAFPNIGLLVTNLCLLAIGGTIFLATFLVATKLFGPPAISTFQQKLFRKIEHKIRRS
jgi:putative peptidoglycan lipid II flippase